MDDLFSCFLGGHPHNWNKIVSVCLSVIHELSDQIQDANWKILASAPVRQQNGDKHTAQNISAGSLSLSLSLCMHVCVRVCVSLSLSVCLSVCYSACTSSYSNSLKVVPEESWKKARKSV